ncbi:TraI domain-containing protein [Plesiomonas shigelloides subsp. oncorhynchi]|nr:TraI domain-containing protein [Plesiomonas shigelloides]
MGKPLSDVSITDKDGSITWNPYSESLHDWAHRHKIDRYFIRWRDKRHKRHEQSRCWRWIELFQLRLGSFCQVWPVHHGGDVRSDLWNQC